MASSLNRITRKFELTPEQLALSQKRQARKQKPTPSNGVDTGNIVNRAWINSDVAQDDNYAITRNIKVMTWNVLAQCLIRRELFPTSDCLKAGQREPMVHREILASKADILCLQEVDRLERLIPVLENAGYSHHYAAAPGKKHGCLIAFSTSMYTKVAEKLVQYDSEDVHEDGSEQFRRGCSFRTRNVGSLISLRSNNEQNEGVIVATTHLFWHPKYTYERTRQAGILVQEVVNFRSELGLDNWPCLICGDFNFAPDDPAYSLLVGDSLNSEQKARLALSRVVHNSIDPTVPPTTKETDEDGGEVDPDRVITNARLATSTDGLLTDLELEEFFARKGPLRSAYDEGLRGHRASSLGHNVSTFGDRINLSSSRRGSHEPEYTSYTHYWKTVLDYIFILNPIDGRSIVTNLLAPHNTKHLEPGLPKKGICGSDHISLAAELRYVYKNPE